MCWKPSRCFWGLWKDLDGALALAGGMGAGGGWSLGQSGTALTLCLPWSLGGCSKNAGCPFCKWLGNTLTGWGWQLEGYLVWMGWFSRPLGWEEQNITQATLSHRIFCEGMWSRSWTGTVPVSSQDPAQYLGSAPFFLPWDLHLSPSWHLCPRVSVCRPLAGLPWILSSRPWRKPAWLAFLGISAPSGESHSCWAMSPGMVVTSQLKG